MKKIKILTLSSDQDGVGYYRINNPHATINDPDIEIDIRMMTDGTLPLLNEKFMSQYDIIYYNKTIPFNKTQYKDQFNAIIKKYNIKLVYDLDDYWVLTNSHPNYKQWKESGSQEMIEKQISNSDMIITTTEYLADKIREFNTNVFIVPNAVNLKEQQWNTEKHPATKTRFLWGGGITHLVDLRLLKKSIDKFQKGKILDKSQLYLCGYDLRMNTPQGVKIDDPKRSTWTMFESIFTNNMRWIKNGEYSKWLRQYTDNGKMNFGYNSEFKNEFYQRRWTKSILHYGTMYREADVVLAPLKNNTTFNNVKSQLKVIEAGAYSCPIICSNYGPYTIDDIEGKKDGLQKGILVDENNPLGWYDAIKFYLDNPEKVKEHGDNLRKYVEDNYEISVVNKHRVDLYKKLVNGEI
jgi:glycosyltransferase involved in cell wall biosynthesis